MFDKITIDAATISKIKDIGLIIGFTYLFTQSLVLMVRRVFFKHISLQSKMLISKAIIYAGVIIGIFLIIDTLELRGVFKTLLGAAGVLGVVLGIASQTSIGNIVSGIFLISEKPFEIGDLIKIGDKMGKVYSIDLLSIKLKTHDNLLIRIPNQTIISTEVTNITKFPIRRMDIILSIAYKDDIKKAIQLLKQIAKSNPLCLNEPEPLVVVTEFEASGIGFKFGIWFEKDTYTEVRNTIFQDIMNTFTAEGIEIPFPHISVYTGEATKPFPVKMEKGL